MTRTTELTRCSRASSWALWPAPCRNASPWPVGAAGLRLILEIILSDEVNRAPTAAPNLRLHNAGFEETCRLEDFDWSASITLDRRLLDAVFSLEFLDRHEHVLLVGPPVSARASSPRPWATPPSAPDTPCASATPTTSSRP